MEDLPECEDYSEDDEIHISEAENDVEENTEEEEKATPAEDLIEAHCGGGDDGDEVKNEENQLDIENNLATETVEVKEEPLSEAQNTDVSTNLKRSKRQAGARARSRNPTPDVTPAAKEGEGVDAPADAAEENQPLGMKKRGRKRKILMSL